MTASSDRSAAATHARAETHRLELEGPDGPVVLLEESHAVPLVSLTLALRSGSAHDPPGKEGALRVAGRMLRRGCESLDARSIENMLDRLGAELAVDVSASSIALHAQVIARNLDAFVDLLSRLVSSPTFPLDEFERLKRESIAEIIEARDSDQALAQRAFRRALFAGHPYGRSARGTTKSLASLSRDDAQAAYAAHLSGSNAVIGLAGDVPRERVREIASRLVGGLPQGSRVADPVPPPPVPEGRRLVLVDKPERTQTQILIGTLGTSPHDADHVALSVANAVLGGSFTSRLMREVRSKRGWSYGAYARLAIDRQRQAFSMWTFPAATDVGPCIDLELRLLESFVNEGVTARELDFIKRFLIRSHAFDVDTATKRMHQALDVEVLKLPPDYYSAYVEHVAGVTVEKANEAVRARISAENLVVVVVGTAAQILEPVRAAIPRLAGERVVPFDDEETP